MSLEALFVLSSRFGSFLQKNKNNYGKREIAEAYDKARVSRVLVCYTTDNYKVREARTHQVNEVGWKEIVFPERD